MYGQERLQLLLLYERTRSGVWERVRTWDAHINAVVMNHHGPWTTQFGCCDAKLNIDTWTLSSTQSNNLSLRSKLLKTNAVAKKS